MKKIWSYIAIFFIGLSSGIVIAIKYLVPEKTVIRGKIRLNQRGKGNTQLTDIRPQIDAKMKRETKKQEKEQKRNERKADRLNKKN